MTKRRNKNKKILITLALIVLVAISIGYAALSTELKINGTADIAATSWNIHFENVQVTNGSVAVDENTTAPSVAEGNITTTQLNYAVTLEKPGDFYEFTVDVKNGGTINAKIAEDGISKTMRVGNNDLTEAQAKLVNYTVTYLDGTEIAEGDKIAKNGTANNADKRTLKVRVEYKSDITAEELNAVDSDIALNLTFGLNYVQD